MQKILLLRALDALRLWHGCFSCDPGMCALGIVAQGFGMLRTMG